MARAEEFSTQMIIEALKASKGMVHVAARSLGCSHTTIYNRAKDVKAVQAAIDAERGLFIDTAELALWKAVQSGEGWAVAFALKTLGKKRGYTERIEIVNFDPSKLSDEQLERIVAGEDPAEVVKSS